MTRPRWLVALLLVAATAPAPAPSAASAPSAAGLIRVAVVERARAVELRGGDIEVSDLGGCESCPRRAWRGSVIRAAANGSGLEVDGRQGTAFRLRSEGPIKLNGREYSAPIELLKNGEGMAVVNELPLEDYLVGVLRAEASERWPLEALRAQAIVARSYAAYHRMISAGKPFHIVASTAHQQYFGRVPPASPVWGAVRETTGQVLRWEDELFPAFYHTESGGYTEDPRTVFAARNMPGLKAVRCEFSTGSPHFYWNLDLRLSALAEILRKNGMDLGEVAAIQISERTPSLRAATITVHGARASARIRGNDFRRMVGYDTLKSTLFAVAIDGGVARFAGRGYGHGVGMCQWGAKGMAEQGYSARQILEYYYPGAVLGALNGR